MAALFVRAKIGEKAKCPSVGTLQWMNDLINCGISKPWNIAMQ